MGEALLVYHIQHQQLLSRTGLHSYVYRLPQLFKAMFGLYSYRFLTPQGDPLHCKKAKSQCRVRRNHRAGAVDVFFFNTVSGKICLLDPQANVGSL
jgi:hypothetical protein